MPAPTRNVRAGLAGLVLAAGRSSRMGSATNKLLEEIDGISLVARCVDAIGDLGADPVWVVTGFEAEAVRAALAGRRVRFVHHSGWADGIGASIARGVGALRDAPVEALLLALGDLPHLEFRSLAPLLGNPGEGLRDRIRVPTHTGRRGHPVLIGAAFFDELAGLQGDRGARSVLERHPDAVVEVPVTSDGILLDVDTPGDLRAARERTSVARSEATPRPEEQ